MPRQPEQRLREGTGTDLIQAREPAAPAPWADTQQLHAIALAQRRRHGGGFQMMVELVCDEDRTQIGGA